MSWSVELFHSRWGNNPSMTRAERFYVPPCAANCTDFSAETCLPLASIIILNYNYGAFLREAVESAFRQTYPNIECLIVDDASTDDSAEVAADLKRQHPTLKLTFLKENGGQAAACVAGLEASRGEFIHFLDADDFVHPEFIETHVATHLSLRFAAGFSCCDMLYSHCGRIVATADSNLSRYHVSSSRTPALLRPLSEHAATRAFPLKPIPQDGVYSAPPWAHGWPWAATSAIVFRRRALEFFADKTRAKAIRRSADAYFCYGINAMTGSVLIDSPLAIYRLHGANAHLSAPPLDHVAGYDRDARIAKSANVVEALLDYVIADCDRFQRLFSSRQGYYHFVKWLAAQHPTKKLTPRNLILRNFAVFRRAFGFGLPVNWILGLKTKV